jgi:hypothetical protein
MDSHKEDNNSYSVTNSCNSCCDHDHSFNEEEIDLNELSQNFKQFCDANENIIIEIGWTPVNDMSNNVWRVNPFYESHGNDDKIHAKHAVENYDAWNVYQENSVDEIRFLNIPTQSLKPASEIFKALYNILKKDTGKIISNGMWGGIPCEVIRKNILDVLNESDDKNEQFIDSIEKSDSSQLTLICIKNGIITPFDQLVTDLDLKNKTQLQEKYLAQLEQLFINQYGFRSIETTPNAFGKIIIYA